MEKFELLMSNVSMCNIQRLSIIFPDNPCNQAAAYSKCMQIDPRCGWCLDTVS